MTTNTRAISTIAVGMRFRRLMSSPCLRFRRRGPAPESGLPAGPAMDVAEAPVPFLIIHDGPEEMFPAEIRPEDGRDPDLRVGDLPEQEIRDPELAAGADEEVRVGNARGQKEAPEALLVEVAGPDPAAAEDGPGGLHDLG